jgi:hypothetical protein
MCSFISATTYINVCYSALLALPQDLASDIQQFSESDFARQYFSTHRTGFIFRRTVPVAQLMSWQKVCNLLVEPGKSFLKLICFWLL